MDPLQVIFHIAKIPPPRLKHPEKWSPEFNNFLEQCLRINPAERPSAKDLLAVSTTILNESIAPVHIEGQLFTDITPITREKSPNHSPKEETSFGEGRRGMKRKHPIYLPPYSKRVSMKKNKETLSRLELFWLSIETQRKQMSCIQETKEAPP